MTLKFPEETLKKMEKAMGILTELDEARGFQKTQAADMGKCEFSLPINHAWTTLTAILQT